MAIRQSFAWNGFARTGIAPDKLIAGAAAIGYAGIEMAPPEFWPAIRDAGMGLVTITGHKLAPAGLNSREAFPEIEAAIMDSLEKAVAWRIPHVICFSGNRTENGPDEAAAITAEHLRKLAPAFEAAGITLLPELLNSKVNHRDYEADHTAWGVKVCAMVASPRVKLLYDIYHMQIMEGDLIRIIRENKDAIAHYHTAGNPGRNDLDADQEINYPAVIRAIAGTGYDGFIGHEFMPKGDALEALRAAHELIANALSAPPL
ncbi:TIM barrel protein [soil metagenome]